MASSSFLSAFLGGFTLLTLRLYPPTAAAEGRLAPTLFELAHSYEELYNKASAGEDGLLERVKWVSKAYFVPEYEYGGGEELAQRLGSLMAEEETRLLLRVLSNGPDAESLTNFAQDGIQEVLTSMREDGYEPSVILSPPSFGFEGGAEFDDPRSGVDTSPPEGMPPGATKRFLGRIGGVPVFGSESVPNDRLLVTDLTSLGTWQQWAAAENGDRLSLEIETFDEERALELVEEEADFFRTPDRESAKDRAADLRTHVRVRLVERCEINVEDRAAARWAKTSS
jgi:hypothetical protein